ncbi:unnamed protein product [Paramecium sonneborni]|uniref:C2H2-type domain-containing protein n=1 Tax=Paramecium sonneborni TaxID=65129 RepID=A0A8S1M2M9_9CILI|nr:unnamed protein product [Paramecium sonneborni]
MLPKFQNSFAQDKNLQTLIESFNSSQKNPNPLARNRYNSYVPYGAGNNIRQTTNSTQTLNIFQEKVSFTLQSNPSVISTLTNDQQDIILKFQLNNRNLQIFTLDKIPREQKEEELTQNPYISYQYQQQQQQKQKIDFKLEDVDEIEVNGNDNLLIISTKSLIKYTKIEQNKKPIQNLPPEIYNKNETQVLQIQFKFLREWYTKLGNNLYAAKKVLQEFLKTLTLPKMKFTAFDQQQPVLSEPQVQHPQPDPNKKPQKIEKQEVEKEPEDVEQPVQISEKDLQNLFPHVTEEFVQRQREALEKKNQTTDEKIKRLFEEVKIRQYKSQPYNTDKNSFKCPYHKCQKIYKKPNQLKNHLKTNHQKLSEIGFTIDDNGEYKYNERILDYCLLLWKVYPNFVKSVINEMRQRKEQTST